MTATTINRPAALRALADHIEGCELDADIISIQFEDCYSWAGPCLHIHTAEMVAAWVQSLRDVEARAFWSGNSVHVRITGAITCAGDDVPVRLLFIATPSDKDVIRAFRDTLETTSGRDGGTPIELPVALGGSQ